MIRGMSLSPKSKSNQQGSVMAGNTRNASSGYGGGNNQMYGNEMMGNMMSGMLGSGGQGVGGYLGSRMGGNMGGGYGGYRR
jgi:conjugal transfer pilus assembly protein TraB